MRAARLGAKKYASLFRIRFTNGMQYRVAAIAGMTTQFFWGFMEILIFSAFYQGGTAEFPMRMQALTSYLWLQQAFLAMFMIWNMDWEPFELISNGNVAYELCRPLNLYSLWFVRSLASRLSRTALRCLPILVVAAFLPKPYGLSGPVSVTAFGLFLISALLAFLLVAAFCMLVYISCFYTMSPLGVRIVAGMLGEFLSGQVVPLPFLPDDLRRVLELLPFASMQNLPFRIYGGDIAGADAFWGILLQLFWLAVFLIVGKLWMARALRRVVVQGG